MMNKYKHIEDLLERFFDGMTTNEEEQQLYSFFAGSDVPEHLHSYKPVFGYFESGLAEELDHSEEKRDSVKLRLPGRKWWVAGLSIAATLLILLSVSPLLLNESRTFDPFEGSYIIQNGERITDMDQIRPELEVSYQLAILNQERANRLLELSEEPDAAVQIEQEMSGIYCELIQKFPDGAVQEEVKKILEIECN